LRRVIATDEPTQVTQSSVDPRRQHRLMEAARFFASILARPCTEGRYRPLLAVLLKRLLHPHACPSTILVDELDAGILKRPPK
jgi:hypothetical protein